MIRSLGGRPPRAVRWGQRPAVGHPRRTCPWPSGGLSGWWSPDARARSGADARSVVPGRPARSRLPGRCIRLWLPAAALPRTGQARGSPCRRAARPGYRGVAQPRGTGTADPGRPRAYGYRRSRAAACARLPRRGPACPSGSTLPARPAVRLPRQLRGQAPVTAGAPRLAWLPPGLPAAAVPVLAGLPGSASPLLAGLPGRRRCQAQARRVLGSPAAPLRPGLRRLTSRWPDQPWTDGGWIPAGRRPAIGTLGPPRAPDHSVRGLRDDGRGTARHLDAGARSARHAGSAGPGQAVRGPGDDAACRGPLTRGAGGNRAVPDPRAAGAPAADPPLHQVAARGRAGCRAGGTAAAVHVPAAAVQPGAVPARPVLRRDHAAERERDGAVAVRPGRGRSGRARPARRVLPGPAGGLLPAPRAGRRDPPGAHPAARRR